MQAILPIWSLVHSSPFELPNQISNKMLGPLLVLLGTLAFLYALLKQFLGRNADFWPSRGVRSLHSDFSFWQVLTAQRSAPDFDAAHYKELGPEPLGGTLELGYPLLFIKDLDLIKHVMVKDFDSFPDHRDFIETDPLNSKSLFFMRGQEWRDMRGFLSPTFTSGKIRRMFHHFENSSVKLREYISAHHELRAGGGYQIPIKDVMGRYTADVIGAVGFGIEIDALQNPKSVFYEMAKSASDFTPARKMAKFGLFTFCTRLANWLRMEILDREDREFFYGILSKAIRSRKGSTEGREDFIQLLVEAKEGRLKDDGAEAVTSYKKPKVELTEELAISQAFIFFMAGFDGIATLLSSTATLLAAHPDVQAKLFAEVEKSKEENGGKITYEGVSKMQYMEMVVAETLRMFPPVARLERTCVQKTKLPGFDFEIPPGVVIAVPAESIHYDEKYYKNPEAFDPERFSAEEKAKRNQYTYLPFGTGPRNCIGMRLALIEAKVALSYVVSNYQLRPVPGKTPIPVKLKRYMGFIQFPQDIAIEVIPRHK